MKKIMPIIVFVFSLCFFSYALLTHFKEDKPSLETTYYPKNNIKFENKMVKLKKNEKAVIHVLDGKEDKIKYRISDSTKVRIISSSFQGCIIERISDYEGEVSLYVYNEEYEELSDVCFISCYNEIISCDKIFLYKEGLNEMNNESEIALGDGIYYLEVSTTRLQNSFYEEESKKYIKKNIEEFFAVSSLECNPLYGEICYKLIINTDNIFAFEKRKTMSFKVDRANFICSFIKAI